MSQWRIARNREYISVSVPNLDAFYFDRACNIVKILRFISSLDVDDCEKRRMKTIAISEVVAYFRFDGCGVVSIPTVVFVLIVLSLVLWGVL